MAQTLIKSVLFKLGKSVGKPINNAKPLIAISCQNYSSTQDKETNVVKSVFISQSSDIFTNLALEDWIYRHFDFSKHHVLLLWRNSPCVVIGRHQNPWSEANVSRLSEDGIPIARRNSGGGTVYHDGGNLNLTFFTPRGRYDRRANLELIGRALATEFGIRTNISPREDILLEGDYKQVSGTAAKLGYPNAYHHCTLLVNVNMPNLHDSLHKEDDGIHTTATRSLPSIVRNLSEVYSGLTVDHVLGAVGREYLRTDAAGRNSGTTTLSRRGFQLINPSESWFPGLEKLRQDMSSWNWRFGKTPRFDVTRSFPIPRELATNEAVTEAEKLNKVSTGDTSSAQLTVKMEVVNGRVSDVTITIPPGFLGAAPDGGEIAVVTGLRGKRFSEEALRILDESFTVSDPSGRTGQPPHTGEKNRFVASCVRKVMQSV